MNSIFTAASGKFLIYYILFYLRLPFISLQCLSGVKVCVSKRGNRARVVRGGFKEERLLKDSFVDKTEFFVKA